MPGPQDKARKPAEGGGQWPAAVAEPDLHQGVWPFS